MSYGTITLCAALLASCTLAAPSDQQANSPVDDTTAKEYLQQFAYMDKPTGGDPYLVDKHVLRKALMNFQSMAHIPITGELDNTTRTMMAKPRCGLPDVDVDEKPLKRRRRFAVFGGQWKKTTFTYKYIKYTQRLERKLILLYTQRAFDTWSDVTPLKFSRVSGKRPDIRLMFARRQHGDKYPFDGPGKTYAHAFKPRKGGDVHFDDDEHWAVDRNVGIDFLQVAIHEIGHSLGLGHSKVNGSIMGPIYSKDRLNKLHADDIKGMQYLYGTNVNNPNSDRRSSSPFCAIGKLDAASRVDDGHIYVFLGKYFIDVVSNVAGRRYPRFINSVWREVKTPLDAVLYVAREVRTLEGKGGSPRVTSSPAHTLFFKGRRVWRYERSVLAPGYPKLISELFEGLPKSIDAAFPLGMQEFIATKGMHYYRFGNLEKGKPNSPSFDGLPSRVDAAVKHSSNYTLFFNGLEYYLYDHYNASVVSGQRGTIKELLRCSGTKLRQRLPSFETNSAPPSVDTMLRDADDDDYDEAIASRACGRRPAASLSMLAPLFCLLVHRLLPTFTIADQRYSAATDGSRTEGRFVLQ